MKPVIIKSRHKVVSANNKQIIVIKNVDTVKIKQTHKQTVVMKKGHNVVRVKSRKKTEENYDNENQTKIDHNKNGQSQHATIKYTPECFD